MMPAPQALLLDFGGVIVDTLESADWRPELVRAVSEVLTSAGVAPVPASEVLEPLAEDDGMAEPFWTTPAPTQVDHVSYWREVVAAEWPARARAVVAAHAETLSRRLMEAKYADGWQVRPGMARLLADAHDRGLAMAIVSNTLSGAAHRAFLAQTGLADRFVVQVYSDEEGVRKPNPEIAHRALGALGVEAAHSWFVGDTLSRDVLVARRAELGAAVLMRSDRVERPPHPDVTPDAVVADPVELHTLVAAHW